MSELQPAPRGHLVLVVGPSGVGKDSVIDFARSRFDGDGRIAFARRCVTRASGIGEVIEALSPTDFEAARAAGAFALSWRSHGLGYGIRTSVRDDLVSGRVVVANVSRTILSQTAGVAEGRTIVELTASPDVLARRLRARERETVEDIAARLARRVSIEAGSAAYVVLDNSGDLSVAGEAMVVLLSRLADVSRAGSAQRF